MSSEYVLDPGSEIKCPHCDEKQEGIVNDYVVTGRPGAYDEQCGGCDSWFTVSLHRSHWKNASDKRLNWKTGSNIHLSTGISEVAYSWAMLKEKPARKQ